MNKIFIQIYCSSFFENFVSFLHFIFLSSSSWFFAFKSRKVHLFCTFGLKGLMFIICKPGLREEKGWAKMTNWLWRFQCCLNHINWGWWMDTLWPVNWTVQEMINLEMVTMKSKQIRANTHWNLSWFFLLLKI